MFALLHSLAMFVIDFFKSPRRLEAENLFLRHQLSIALRRAPSRLRLRGSDRALLVWMTRLWPSLLGAAQVVQPETILRWHRAGFTTFWRWTSRKRTGRPGPQLEHAGRAERMIGGGRHWHGAGPVGAREACRLAKPDQLGDRLHLSFDEHTGRVAIGVFFDREHVDGRNRVAGDACPL
jgi:hypothetical protein